MEKPILKVVFFARLREIIAIDELVLDFDDQQTATVQNIITILTEKYSAFNDYIDQGNRLMIAVNQQITDANKELQSGDELALFPPVTGG